MFLLLLFASSLGLGFWLLELLLFCLIIWYLGVNYLWFGWCSGHQGSSQSFIVLLCVSASLISRHTVHSGEGEATPPVSIGVQIVLLLVASVLVLSFVRYDHVSSYAASYACT